MIPLLCCRCYCCYLVTSSCRVQSERRTTQKGHMLPLFRLGAHHQFSRQMKRARDVWKTAASVRFSLYPSHRSPLVSVHSRACVSRSGTPASPPAKCAVADSASSLTLCRSATPLEACYCSMGSCGNEVVYDVFYEVKESPLD